MGVLLVEGGEAVHGVHVLVDENAVPGDDDVIEDSHAVHLVEAAGEGVVGGLAAAVGLAADEAQSRGVGGDSEYDGVLLVGLGGEASAPVDGGEAEELVGVGAGGGDGLGAADNEALVGLPDDAEVQVGVLLLRGGL